MQRILVVRGGAIGDFVLTLPAIKLLRDGFADARLEILGYKYITALAEKRFYADATRSIEYAPFARFFAKTDEFGAELVDYFRSFDLVVSYLFDPDKLFEGNVRRCGVENFLACSPIVDLTEHAALQLARPLTQLGLTLRSPGAQLYPSALDRGSAASFLQASAEPIIALHPGSGGARKNWPLAHWSALAQQLLDRRVAESLLIISGEADEKAATAMRESLRGRAVRFADGLPLPQLAAVLERCALFVGHDSGISHIAAAVGTPTVLLFGPTDPHVWAPANENVRVLRAPSEQLSDLLASSVFEAARAAISQSSEKFTS